MYNATYENPIVGELFVNQKRLLCAVLLISAPLFSSPLYALDEDGGAYVGLSLGATEFFNEVPLCERFEEEVADALDGDLGQSFLVTEAFAELVFRTECTHKTSDTSQKLVLGYRFNQSIAVELAYVDFGTPSLTLDASLASELASGSGTGFVSADITGFSVSGLAGVPLGERASLYLRFGVLSWEAEGRGTASGALSVGGIAGSQSFVASLDGADVHYGVGARWRLSDHTALRAEWEHYEIADLDMLSAGVEFSFH